MCHTFFLKPLSFGDPLFGHAKCSTLYITISENLLNLAMLSEVKEKSDLSECNCLPSCTSIKYDMDVSTEESGTEIRQMSNVMTDLTFVFNDVEFIPMTRNELFGNADFLANLGGLLGLFCGFSALSFFEIVYYLTLRWICRICGLWTRILASLGNISY
nr:PREDICTED: pickpocket protein 28 [Tribolium castaneum]|eukprot:XP_015839370.1 PREDICTED: pickpocket protein 28 [Tribolium castaneum]